MKRPGLFAAFGIELEYMLVDRATLAVRPAADEALRLAAGSAAYVSDAACGPMTWSNELVAHVLELKVEPPAASLLGLAPAFHAEIQAMNARLKPLNLCLLPGAMHPLMRPAAETRVWPHDYAEIYAAFHRIFDCHTHGWANLQSVHLNLPFAGEREFARLHAAVRAVLPLLPALAASSPFQEGRATGLLDTRLENYRHHMDRVPLAAGRVIPEPVYTEAEYRAHVFAPMFAQIAPFDTDGVLQEEFLNARGAIARFDRGSVEVRLLDVQECPLADLAICELVQRTVRALCDERWMPLARLQAWPVERLHTLLLATMRDADRATVSDAEMLEAFGCAGATSLRAGEIWARLLEALWPVASAPEPERAALEQILKHGPLARRILAAAGPQPHPQRIVEVYAQLAGALERGCLFLP
ncbi:MAG: glutamate--cysteine ligase [Planctomycetes bacterium]|nr:glutamate--cysteine ligase [Planctomycetota bacterium]